MGVRKQMLLKTTAMAAVFNYIAQKKAEAEDMRLTIFNFQGLKIKLDLRVLRVAKNRRQIGLVV